MGMMKNYLLTVMERCSDQEFGQLAVEWAIVCGHVKLTCDLDTDLRQIFAEVEPGLSPCCGAPPLGGEPAACLCSRCHDHTTFDKPTTRYDAICAGYRNHCRQNTELLVDSYAPLLAQLQA